jgi:hypothetical protein
VFSTDGRDAIGCSAQVEGTRWGVHHSFKWSDGVFSTDASGVRLSASSSAPQPGHDTVFSTDGRDAMGCPAQDLEFRVSSFGFRFWSFRFRISGFGFRISYFGIRASCFVFRVSVFGVRVSGFVFRASVFVFRVSCFVFRVGKRKH